MLYSQLEDQQVAPPMKASILFGGLLRTNSNNLIHNLYSGAKWIWNIGETGDMYSFVVMEGLCLVAPIWFRPDGSHKFTPMESNRWSNFFSQLNCSESTINYFCLNQIEPINSMCDP